MADGMTIDVERRLARVLNYFGWSPSGYGDMALAAKFIERLAEEHLVIAAEYGTPSDRQTSRFDDPASPETELREALDGWLTEVGDRNMTPGEATLYDALRAALTTEEAQHG